MTTPKKGNKKKKNEPTPVQYEPSSYEKHANENRKRNIERLKEVGGDDFDLLKRNAISTKVSNFFNLCL